jgi:hypothetical protein
MIPLMKGDVFVVNANTEHHHLHEEHLYEERTVVVLVDLGTLPGYFLFTDGRIEQYLGPQEFHPFEDDLPFDFQSSLEWHWDEAKQTCYANMTLVSF